MNAKVGDLDQGDRLIRLAGHLGIVPLHLRELAAAHLDRKERGGARSRRVGRIERNPVDAVPFPGRPDLEPAMGGASGQPRPVVVPGVPRAGEQPRLERFRHRGGDHLETVDIDIGDGKGPGAVPLHGEAASVVGHVRRKAGGHDRAPWIAGEPLAEGIDQRRIDVHQIAGLRLEIRPDGPSLLDLGRVTEVELQGRQDLQGAEQVGALHRGREGELDRAGGAEPFSAPAAGRIDPESAIGRERPAAELAGRLVVDPGWRHQRAGAA